ncbi:transporter substrate-binding domain-containing protein [Idiomarina sp. HP20-50]|uniref:transporter substrate-binding domain-containing protein n=1 Tax=Idiomarina sp. HP20-50 TaxID=3070813 RepID=UPI00294AA216|nr:transporter substrate-binding domain-containing protein [Idiomarina sp. HP20-50]MDV6316159.1 transporter substrate-binding domain-containing protein [Idiomarina sp. HP20-50]
MRLGPSVLTVALLSAALPAHSHAEEVGMATGYPPFQFNQDGEPVGFDLDVTRAIFNYLQKDLSLHQYDWDNVVSLLRYGELDVAIGMESTAFRQAYFDFSQAYYHRIATLFVLDQDSSPSAVRQLVGKRISGDRHSVLEQHLKELGLSNAIRIEQADSKNAAMAQLAAGEVEAVIMPETVGRYLANEMNLPIRILWQPDIKVPVSFAVKSGDSELIRQINGALEHLEATGQLDEIRQRWSIQHW